MAKRYRRRTQKPQAEAAPAAPAIEPAEDDIEEYDDGEPETVPTIDTAELEPIPLPEPATADVVSPEGEPAPFEEHIVRRIPEEGEVILSSEHPVAKALSQSIAGTQRVLGDAVSLSGISIPSADPLAQALTAWGLREEHVLAIGGTEAEPTIMTRGGRKLRWPRDAHVKLTESERDGVIRGTKHLDTPWNRQLAKEKAKAGK